MTKLRKQLLKEERKTSRKTNRRFFFRLIGGLLLLSLSTGGFLFYNGYFEDALEKQYQRATALLDEGEYRRAISRLRGIHEHHPESSRAPQALYLAGEVLFLHLDENQEALLNFLLIERDYPDSDWCQAARRRVAEIYKDHLRDYERALVAYQKLLDAGASQPDRVQYDIADCYFRLNNFEQARIEFENLLKNHPDSALLPEVLYRIGAAFFLEGKLHDAELVLTRAQQDHQDSPFAGEATFMLAQVHEERGELKAALKLLQDLEQHYPDKPALTRRLENIRQRIKKKRRAI